MNKGQMIEALAKGLEISKSCASQCLDCFIETLIKAVKKDKEVALAGLGSFRLKTRKARMGRNLRTGQPMKIAASKTVAYKPAAAVKKAVN